MGEQKEQIRFFDDEQLIMLAQGYELRAELDHEQIITRLALDLISIRQNLKGAINEIGSKFSDSINSEDTNDKYFIGLAQAIMILRTNHLIEKK